MMVETVDETTTSKDETTTPEDETTTPEVSEEPKAEESVPQTFDVFYSCMRCGTKVSQTELSRLPEIKCICGFRVFHKARPPVVKTIKAI